MDASRPLALRGDPHVVSHMAALLGLWPMHRLRLFANPCFAVLCNVFPVPRNAIYPLLVCFYSVRRP